MSDPPHDQLKVLIIEDTLSDAELAAEVLMGTWPQLQWRSVATAKDFRASLEWCPDVIIADYEVPGFGAVAALDMMQELSSEIPLIVFTGAVTEETVVRCMRLGAADYLLKDRMTRLSSAVSNALRMRQERDQKRASEHEQRRLAEINSAILRSLPAHVTLLDADGRIVAVNEAWQREGVRSGFDDQCKIGQSYFDVCDRVAVNHKLDASQVINGLQSVLAGVNDSFALEYAIHTGTEKRWLRMMATPVTRGTKGGAVVMVLNVTDRRLAEEQLKINSNALRHLAEGVAITDADLRIVTVNKAFTNITGHDPEKILGRRLSELIVREQSDLLIENIREAVAQGGGWKGELRSRRANGETFPAFFSFSAVRDMAGNAEYYTAVFTDLSTYREFEQRIEYLSHSDVLTGLPNRAALAKHMNTAVERSRANGSSFALLVAELDSFKVINDTLGHATGDLLLKAVADRLRRFNRAGDVVARLGGDEFGVLARDLADTAAAERIADQLRVAIERPFNIAGQDVFITASIGISSFPTDGETSEALLRAADAAVYRAKQMGRNTVSWHSPEMNAAAIERFTLQNDLHHALARDELILEYQPTIDLYSGRITGAEALLRWRHPQFGIILPTRFIGLAEDTGLIVPIGDWVLRTACRQVKRWVASGWSDATVAVNLSARQFNQPDLEAHIADALTAMGIEPWRLRMEVTESMVMSNPDNAANTLTRLARMGIQLALDDFGTGYSSLNYLKRFCLGCLKVDRSFVSGVASDDEDASIVRAIIALGKALGMKVIAEGIETMAQAEFLRNAGCDDGQGFYYSPATSAAEVGAMAMHTFPLAAGSLQSQLDLTINSA